MSFSRGPILLRLVTAYTTLPIGCFSRDIGAQADFGYKDSMGWLIPTYFHRFLALVRAIFRFADYIGP